MKPIKISTGTISQRKDKKWIGQALVTYEDNSKKRICVSANDKHECFQKLEVKKNDILFIDEIKCKNRTENKTNIKETKTYPEYLLSIWLDEKESEGLNGRVIMVYRYMIVKHFAYFKNTYPSQITPSMIVSFQKFCMETQGLSASTCNKVYNILNNSFNKLVRDEVIEKNPCRYIPRKHEAEKEKILFTKEEINKLFAEAKLNDLPSTNRRPNKIMYPFLLFALSTGCRRSEICCIKWEDINTEKMTCSINKSVTVIVGKEYLSPTKNKQTRTVPISEKLLNELLNLRKRIYKEYHKYSEYVFPDYKDIDFYASPRCIQNSFDTIRKRTGVKKSLHTFRHQFISDALEAGISLRLVQKISGHVTLAVLQKYWHVDEDKYNEIRRLYD